VSVPTIVEAGRIQAFCDVVNDHNPAFRQSWRGGPVLAPPTFINTFRDGKSQLLIEHLGVDMPRLLHGDEIITCHRPLVAGDLVYQQVTIVDVGKKATRAMGNADYFRVRITVHDIKGELMVEAFQSFFVRGDS